MMNYTVIKDDRINEKIQADIDYISDRVAGLLGDSLHALLLCGGFGRGEGSVVIDKGRVHIVNDYDFTVVLNAKNRFRYLKLYKKIHAPLEQLAVELAAELDIKQVDLSPKPLRYFTKEKTLKIENYEVKKGHVLTFGAEDPAQNMPDWQAEDIPLFEGTWLFRNRGAGLLLAALYFQTGGEIPGSKKENFIIECTKAHLAMGDSALLYKKKYHHHYHKRLGIIDTINFFDIPHGEEIKNRYRDALKQKLNPDFNRYLNRDLREWWFDVKKYFEIFFKFFEQERLKIKFNNWCDYSELAKPEDRVEIKTLARKIIKVGKSGFTLKNAVDTYRKSKKSYSVSLVALVLFSIHKNGYDTAMMSRAARILDIKLSGPAEKDWLRLAREVLNEIHPGGEVGRVLSKN